MKKSAKRRPNRGSRKASPATDTSAKPGFKRRELVNRTLLSVAGVVVLGGAGVFGVRSVRATMAEHDLTRLGGGIPAIVQIHDPQCPTCTALQKQTRKALKPFGEDEILYLVANIRTAEGSRFAGRYGVPHVTLLLFDAQGGLQGRLQGMRQADELGAAFARLVRRDSSG